MIARARHPSRSVLVTGAAGFIGSTLCERLIADGWRVVGLDNFNRFYDPAVKRHNVQALLRHRSFRLVQGDIRHPRTLDEAARGGIDTLVHLAAMAGVRPSMERPLLYQKVNVEGTLRILESCRRHSVAHLVFGSSSSVYGNSSHVPFSEDDPAVQPVSVYAATKRAGELLCQTYVSAYGMNITMLRFFTVFGPRQRPDLAIHKFCRLVLRREPLPFFGDGSMERDYTYVDDIVDGIVRSMEHPRGLRLFNLGNDRPVRLDALVQAIENALGTPAELKPLPPQVGDVQRTWASIQRAREQLGYNPRTSLEAGLKVFTAWLKRQTDARSRERG